MKGCLSKVIGFIIIVFILYKALVFIFVDLRLKNADEDFMDGVWVAKTAIYEKVGDYKIVMVYNIALSFNKNNKCGYSIFAYDSDYNIPKIWFVSSWTDNILNAIKRTTNKDGYTYEIRKGRLILNIDGKKYKSKEKVKKTGIFFIKNIYLKSDDGEKIKFKLNFLKIIDKDGNKVVYDNNIVAKKMEEYILSGIDLSQEWILGVN